MSKINKIKNYSDLARILIKHGLLSQSDNFESEDISSEADRLIESIEGLGPAYIKLGQLLATRKELFPKEILDALKALQDDVSPISSVIIRRIIEEDLGAPIKKIFSEFIDEPLATASLGQVHKARLLDGREVVIKVQRPEARKIVVKDISQIKRIIEFLNKHSETFRRYHIQNILIEFEENILRELNYLEEANNLTKIKRNLQSFQDLVFPNVYHSYSSDKILTMDYLDGTKLDDIAPVALTEIDGKSLAGSLFRAYLKQIFIDGFFHSDPHLGNVFYLSNHKIGVLDLGLVTRLGPKMRKDLLKLLIDISEGRGEDAANTAWSMVSPIDGLDENIGLFKEKVSSLVKNYYDRSIKNSDTGRVLLELSKVAALSGFYFPQELSSISRTLIYLDEIGAILDPDFNPHHAIRDNAVNIMKETYKDESSLTDIFYNSVEFTNSIAGLPSKADKVLDDLVNQRLKIKIDALDQEHLMRGFQKIANRITIGLILAALIIGASRLMEQESAFVILGYPGLAIILLISALLGSIGLMVNVFFRDE